MDLKNDSPVQNAPNPPPSTRQSKANISFSQKLPKGDLKDPTSMKTYLSTLADVLPSINELAAAIILGHDFESTRNQISFNGLMKISDTEQIMQLEFTEVTRNNEEPAAHFDQNETSSGKDLIAADRILKSIFALSTTQDTLQTLSAFGTAVEKVEHIRTSLMLKTHSDTTRLFSFLLINNFSDFSKGHASVKLINIQRYSQSKPTKSPEKEKSSTVDANWKPPGAATRSAIARFGHDRHQCWWDRFYNACSNTL